MEDQSMLTREELARAVLDMFDGQRHHFRLRSDHPDKSAALERSKLAEKQLRDECLRILEPPSLFPPEAIP
jgi:hypothetical protein